MPWERLRMCRMCQNHVKYQTLLGFTYELITGVKHVCIYQFLHMFSFVPQVTTRTPRMPWMTWLNMNSWPSWGMPLPQSVSWTIWTIMGWQLCTTRAAGTMSCRLPSGHLELSTTHLREQVGYYDMASVLLNLKWLKWREAVCCWLR